jgi:hypothetical protein
LVQTEKQRVIDESLLYIKYLAYNSVNNNSNYLPDVTNFFVLNILMNMGVSNGDTPFSYHDIYYYADKNGINLLMWERELINSLSKSFINWCYKFENGEKLNSVRNDKENYHQAISIAVKR